MSTAGYMGTVGYSTAHCGIYGNEQSDKLAKLACLEPQLAKAVECHVNNTPRAVVKTLEGAPLGLKQVAQRISEQELQDARSGDDYVDKWNEETTDGRNRS